MTAQEINNSDLLLLLRLFDNVYKFIMWLYRSYFWHQVYYSKTWCVFLMDEQFSSSFPFLIFCKSKGTEQCNISTSPKTQTDSLRPNSTEDNPQTCRDNSTCPMADRRRGTMLSEIPVSILFNLKLTLSINYMIKLLILPFFGFQTQPHGSVPQYHWTELRYYRTLIRKQRPNMNKSVSSMKIEL